MPPPPSALPLVYAAAAHLAVACAAALAIASAESLAASFLTPGTLACVHLVTLGWLTAGALGAVYAVLPLALRTPMPAGWPDVAACVLTLTGASGVVAHMALATYPGVAWSGAAVALGVAGVAWRVIAQGAGSPAPRLQRVAIALAFAALLAAAVAGTLAAVDRERPLVRAGHLRLLAAHAHVALVGWLGLLLAGIGPRLLPMLVPAQPVTGARPWLAVAGLATGAVTLPVAWLTTQPPSRLPALAAVPIVLGAGSFARDVLALRSRRKPKARGLPAPDPALVAVAAAVACLIAGAGLGMALLLFEAAAGWIAVYGVLVVIGGFGGLLLGVGLRLWPLLVWRRAFGDGTAGLPVRPASLPSLALQWLAVAGWCAATALLAGGAGRGAPGLVRAGGCAWLVAAVAAGVNFALVCKRGRRR